MMVVPDIRCSPTSRSLGGQCSKQGRINGRRSCRHLRATERPVESPFNTMTAAGIRAGSHIGFLGKNSAAFFEVWVGANKAGCALAPLNWRAQPQSRGSHGRREDAADLRRW